MDDKRGLLIALKLGEAADPDFTILVLSFKLILPVERNDTGALGKARERQLVEDLCRGLGTIGG